MIGQKLGFIFLNFKLGRLGQRKRTLHVTLPSEITTATQNFTWALYLI